MTQMTSTQPDSTPPIAYWQDALEKGKLLLQRADVGEGGGEGGDYVFPPRLAMAGKSPLKWVEASGTGVIYSATIIRPRPPEAPYNVVLVDLDEGVRMMGNIIDAAPEQVVIGAHVRAVITDQNGTATVMFALME